MTVSATDIARSSDSDSATETSVDRSAKLAQKAAAAIWERKGFEVVALRVLEIVQYTDFIVICSATSDRHAVAIADSVEKMLREELGETPSGVEGRTYGRWILLDYCDIVVHVFQKSVRDYYQLERLFLDAPRLPLAEPQWVREISPDSLLQQAFDYGDELWSSAALSDAQLAEAADETSDAEATDDAAGGTAPPRGAGLAGGAGEEAATDVDADR